MATMSCIHPKIELTRQPRGDNLVVTTYTAWEPSDLLTHGLLVWHDGAWCGQIGTRRESSKVHALPLESPERHEACKLEIEREYERAYATIYARYPELYLNIDYKARGELEVWTTVECLEDLK